MKSKFAIYSAAAVTASILISAALFTQHQAKAADVPSAGETYKVMDADSTLNAVLAGGPDALELKLNTYGAMGWKVRTALGHYIILAK